MATATAGGKPSSLKTGNGQGSRVSTGVEHCKVLKIAVPVHYG